MMVKQETISGPLQETLFAVIMLNPESTCTEINRRDQGYEYIVGCGAGDKYRRLLNVDGDRGLSDKWTGFTRFTIWMKNHRMDVPGPVRRLTRKQTTSRPDTLWPEIWKDMSEASKRKEMQKCAIEKPKLDNARKMFGIYYIDPADQEFGEIVKKKKKRVESWKFRCQQQCLAEADARRYRETCGAPGVCKTKYACTVEADESTRKLLEGTLHKGHEDHIAVRGINSLFRAQIYSYA